MVRRAGAWYAKQLHPQGIHPHATFLQMSCAETVSVIQFHATSLAAQLSVFRRRRDTPGKRVDEPAMATPRKTYYVLV